MFGLKAKWAVSFLLLTAFVGNSFAEFAAPWPTAGWGTSSPEAQGVNSAALAGIVGYGAANGMDSFLITRHGQLIAEAYFAPFRSGLKHAVNSTTKGVVGTLTGMAIQDGLLTSRDLPVLDFFPEHPPANLTPPKKSITIGNLLDMTSGLDWKEKLDGSVPESLIAMSRSNDWQAFVLDRPMAATPGTEFNYNSGNAHLLSSIIAKKTGGSTLAYAKRRLFEPLGIQDVRWIQDPRGVEIGGYGIFLQPRDMAKIGYLYLRKGQWEGKQLLPAAWVDQVFNASIDMGPVDRAATFHYANGWWTIPSKHAYLTVGLFRQLIIVMPDIDVVAVVTGHRHYPMSTLVDMIAASARSTEPLPPDTKAQQQLAEAIRRASVEQASNVAAPPQLATSISGKKWEFERNPLGVKEFTLNLNGSNSTYSVVYEKGRGPVVGTMGLEGLFRVSEQANGRPTGLKGSWIDPQTFQIVSRSIAEGSESVYTLRFEGSQVTASIQTNGGFKAQVQGRAAE